MRLLTIAIWLLTPLAAHALDVTVQFEGVRLTRWIDGAPTLHVKAEEGRFATATESMEMLGLSVDADTGEGRRRLQAPRSRWDLHKNILTIDGPIEGEMFLSDAGRTEKVRFSAPRAEYEVGSREIRSRGPVEFVVEYGGPRQDIRAISGRVGRVRYWLETGGLHIADGLELRIVWP